MIKIIYINRLEMNYKYYSIKTTTTALVIGIVMLCTMLLMKSNYREYIKGKNYRLKARLKGTPGGFSHEGLRKRKKILFISFETWLYFLICSNIALNTDISWLCNFYNLVIFLKMWL